MSRQALEIARIRGEDGPAWLGRGDDERVHR
jgi:hypothetical protein